MHFREPGIPPQLSVDVRQEVFEFEQADQVLKAWKPEGSLDIDGLLFALTSLATGAEQEWALCLWCREALFFRRFSHLTPGVFQQVKMEAQNTISAAPVGRLLDWHFRISQAHQRKALHDNMDPLLTRPNNPLRGRTADGAFRTAAAKEYPSLLCRALINHCHAPGPLCTELPGMALFRDQISRQLRRPG